MVDPVQKDWKKKMANGMVGLNLGHDAVMLEDAREVLAANRKRTREPSEVDDEMAEEGQEEMGNLQIGDNVYHVTEVQPPQDVPITSSLEPLAASGEQDESKFRKYLPWALAVALGGTTAAAAFWPDSPTDDADTEYRMRFYEDED